MKKKNEWNRKTVAQCDKLKRKTFDAYSVIWASSNYIFASIIFKYHILMAFQWFISFLFPFLALIAVSADNLITNLNLDDVDTFLHEHETAGVNTRF